MTSLLGMGIGRSGRVRRTRGGRVLHPHSEKIPGAPSALEAVTLVAAHQAGHRFAPHGGLSGVGPGDELVAEPLPEPVPAWAGREHRGSPRVVVVVAGDQLDDRMSGPSREPE